MGAWGVETLENDIALDEFDFFVGGISLSTKFNEVKNAILDFLDNEYVDVQLLGVKLIEVGVTKVDNIDGFSPISEYKDGVDRLIKLLMDNDCTSLIPNALSSLKNIRIKDLHSGWICLDERLDYLKKIENNLKAKSNN